MGCIPYRTDKRRALVDSVSETTHGLNLKAFQKGLEYGVSQRKGLIEKRDSEPPRLLLEELA